LFLFIFLLDGTEEQDVIITKTNKIFIKLYKP
jgi:hypothetical protein